MQYSNPNKISLQRDNPEFFSVLGTPDFYFGLFSILKHKITPKKKNHSEKSAEIRVKLFSQSVEQRTENPCVGGSIPSLPTQKITRDTDRGFFILNKLNKKESKPQKVRWSLPRCFLSGSLPTRI